MQKTLSVCIPTYNRAPKLEKLLKRLISQVLAFKDSVEVCVSNNASTDETRNVVLSLMEKYPNLVVYNENEENLGFDRNLLKVIGMATGLFVWFLGDDDSIVDNGVEEVVTFIKKVSSSETGLIVLRRESYFHSKDSKKRIVYESTLDRKMPAYFKIDRREIYEGSFPDIGFISVLIFNNALVRKVLKEYASFIKMGYRTYYIHMLICRLMFLRYPRISGYALNERIVCQEASHFRFSVEDETKLLQGSCKMEDILLSTEYGEKYASIFVRRKRNLKLYLAHRLMAMRAFGVFNYEKYTSPLGKFFEVLPFGEALLFSTYFIMLSLTPTFFVKGALQTAMKRIYGNNWRKMWMLDSTIYQDVSGSRRRQY